MAATRMGADPDNRIKVYKEQLSQLAQVRTAYNDAAMASGNWHVQTVKNVSASEAFTDQVRKQKLGIGQLTRAYKDYRKTGGGALGEAIKEQTALRNATATQMTSSLFGKNLTDLHLPRNLGPELDNTRTKLGMINQAIGSAATGMVNWGKNTQWAGRQITVGLTMPLGMAAVGAAALALQVDKSLTDVAKVYDTTAKSQMGQEMELAAVREQGLQTATRAANEYGSSLQDTLAAQAQLAATGLNGAELQQATSETMRIATLGQMDYQKSVDMTVSLQTAFKLSNEDLTKSFNTMNAVENATSLSIQDIADAVPRAASALASLGGSVNDMIVMLTAMKESGVDAAEAANAIKSATSTILSPTTKAQEYWKETFGADIVAISKENKGNLLKMMQDLAEVTHGRDAQEVTNGINLLFGKYQFNRAAALFTNLGDAATGTMNQTAKALQVVGESTEELAATADTELTRWQESISGKFKRAVESIKAELIPLGMTTLQVITPVISFVAKLISGFNDLPGPIKAIVMSLLALGAVVGPILMLVGIFANLFGSITKAGVYLANLRLKFRAVNAEEAAAQIMAKKAASAFDTEGAAVANLTMQVKALTEAMKQNAVAQGLMMDDDGTMMSPGADGGPGNKRKVVRDADGNAVYAPDSRNESGNRIDGFAATAEDLAAFEGLADSSEEVADNSRRTRVSMEGVGQAIGAIGAAGAVFATMKSGSASTLDTVINISLVAGSIALMFPGIFTKALAKAKLLVTTMKAAATAGAAANAAGAAGAAGAVAGRAGMVGKLSGALSGMLPILGRIGMSVLKIFGPVGALVAGAIIIKKIVDGMNEAEDAAKALAASGEAWAEQLGYTYAPGVIAGVEDADLAKGAKVVELANSMAEANTDLKDAMVLATDAGRGYEAAMGQALKVLTTGGTLEQARQVFEAALKMGGTEQEVIADLLIKFDQVNLEDPEGVRDALRQQLNDIFKPLQDEPLTMGQVTIENSGYWDAFLNNVRSTFGGDLTSTMRAAGEDAGRALGDGLTATSDPTAQANLFKDLQDNMNGAFAAQFAELGNNPEMAAALQKAGITTADQLSSMMGVINTKIKNDKPLSEAEQAIKDQWDSLANNQAMDNFRSAYHEMLDTLVDGMVRSGNMTEEQAKTIRENIGSINGLKVKVIGAEASAGEIEDVKTAAEEAKEAVDDLDGSTVEITAEMRTNQLKDAMSGTMNTIYSEADRLLKAAQDRRLDRERAAGDRRQAGLEARGRREDKFYDDRAKELDKAQEAETDIFEDNWDAREKGEKGHWDRLENELDSAWDQREKDLDRAWDNREKAEEARFDNEEQRLEDTIELVNDEAERRIEAINAEMEAAEERDELREKLFERERTRIERMAELFSTNVDFNAALRTGDFDEAARISSNADATTQQWGIDDQNDRMDEAAEQRRQELEATIELIEKERDVRVETLEQQKEAMSAAKDHRLEMLRLEREAAEESFEAQRQMAADTFEAQRQAAEESLSRQRELETRAFEARKAEAKAILDNQRQNSADALAQAKADDQARTASSLARVQADIDADNRGLATRLAALQAFTPRNQAELNDHITKVQNAYNTYGANLTGKGNEWSGIVGGALKDNVNRAAISLQNDVNWEAMGKVIAARMEAGTGVSTQDLQYFITNGRFPDQQKGGGMVDHIVSSITGRKIGFHDGGEIGGPGWSAKERTGIPRSANLFQSEQFALLKRGEFVVNDKATRNNRGLLEQINAGKTIARHGGGIADVAPSTAFGTAAMIGQMYETALTSMALQAIAQTTGVAAGVAGNQEGLIGGGKYTGTAPGGSQIDRMYNTILKAFPKAGLNSSYRAGDPGYHGRGKAIDLGLKGTPGGMGNSYIASMKQWIHDNFPGSTELIYNGTGNNRNNLKNGAPLAYSKATQDQHRNHVHWAMQSFHNGGLIPNLNVGGLTLSEGLANLHPGEAVLTKPLTDQITNNVANGGGSSYTVEVNFNGPVNSELDVERAVERAISKRESRNGRSRVVR